MYIIEVLQKGLYNYYSKGANGVPELFSRDNSAPLNGAEIIKLNPKGFAAKESAEFALSNTLGNADAYTIMEV